MTSHTIPNYDVVFYNRVCNFASKSQLEVFIFYWLNQVESNRFRFREHVVNSSLNWANYNLPSIITHHILIFTFLGRLRSRRLVMSESVRYMVSPFPLTPGTTDSSGKAYFKGNQTRRWIQITKYCAASTQIWIPEMFHMLWE